jgi:predicted nucleotidyltransferase
MSYDLAAMRSRVLRRAMARRRSRVFGSVVRGDAGPESDLDLLVDMGERRSLLAQAALQGDSKTCSDAEFMSPPPGD